MASSPSPGDFNQSTDYDDNSRGFKFNLNFLKIGSEKKTTKDGQPVKRPGPKPGTKGPASSRRRELNRQAQRTHRERKENYIKTLEGDVLRLKEICSNLSRDKTRLKEENRQVKDENYRLRELLVQNGIDAGVSVVTCSPPVDSDGHDNFLSTPETVTPMIWYADSNTGTTTATSVAGSQGAPLTSSTSVGDCGGGHGAQQAIASSSSTPTGTSNLDYEQAGIDFVLTLEGPCVKAHVPWVRKPLIGNHSPGHSTKSCGHALMVSCPPEPFHGEQGQPTWELTKADLVTMLELSKEYDLGGEITPVMAWGMILEHPRLGELLATYEDVSWLMKELGRKARCFGFGAVMEEYQVRDAIETLLTAKGTATGIVGVAY